jgi:hypothetical protein
VPKSCGLREQQPLADLTDSRLNNARVYVSHPWRSDARSSLVPDRYRRPDASGPVTSPDNVEHGARAKNREQ